MTATANKGFRVIAVVMGEPTSELRNKEVSEMLDYAYNVYKLDTILTKSDVLTKQSIEKAKVKYVELVPLEDITVLNKKNDGNREYSYNLNIDKLKAPINIGDKVGNIEVMDNGNIIKNIDITVKENVEKANILELYFRYLKEIITM